MGRRPSPDERNSTAKSARQADTTVVWLDASGADEPLDAADNVVPSYGSNAAHGRALAGLLTQGRSA